MKSIASAASATAASPRRWRADVPFLILAVALPALVYFPITRNYFNSDDFLHLFHIVNEDRGKFLLDMHGGHLLMTRNAVFILFHALFGTDPLPYFALVLATHLLNVFLLFGIIRDLTGSPYLACFGSALWGSLPVQEGSLGWYSVYGHVLATTFTLGVLFALVRTALGVRRHPFSPVLWALLLLAAATSFGVGIGVACAMPISAALLLPRSRANLLAVVVLAVLAAALIPLYFRLQRLYVDLYGGVPSSLMLVAMLHYWPARLASFLHLMAVGILSTVVGVFDVIPYPGIAAYGVVAFCCAVLLGTLATGSWALRRKIAAALVLFAAAYAPIAAGRGMVGFGSGAATARYHYLTTAAFAIVLCLVLGEIGSRWRLGTRTKGMLLVGWATVSVVFHLAAGQPIRHFALARQETYRVLAQVRKAARAVPVGREAYIENRDFASVGPFYKKRNSEFPGWAAVFAIYFPSDEVEGRQVRFVEDNLFLIESTRHGRRTAGLLVAPADVSGRIYRPTGLRPARTR